ncbi:MAG: ABC transporter ATP-binding protein [Solirubrobacterales bacterium]
MTPNLQADAAETGAGPVVEARALSKRFDTGRGSVEALEGIDLALDRGAFISLVGPSGCGKSTLLSIVGGLIPPTAGEVRVKGRRVTGPPVEVGMMFQASVLLEWRTARANVLLPVEVHGGRRAVGGASARADELLRLVGLDGFEDRYPNELSGGMQQRVAICRMLIADPEVLLLDEPFGALDELTRERMNVELARIVESTSKAAILVTHNIQEAVFLADRVYAMTPRPGRFAGIVEVDIPRPRRLELLTTEPFQRLCRDVRTLLDQGAAAGDDAERDLQAEAVG